jgi:ribosome-binding protein aMBF1 (putative translation factor)
MECAVCKKSDVEVQLYEGILDHEVVKVCKSCADLEDIPVIRKPSQEQLNRADTSQSVRERMERLSSGGRRPVTEISSDQSTVQRNIARLRAPASKNHNPDVLDNYYWELNIARRRRKLSLVQLAEMTGIPSETIKSIEQGQIPRDFEQMFLKLENALGIKMLKEHKREAMFHKPRDENQIIESVRTKLGQKQSNQRPKTKEEIILGAIQENRLRDKKEKVEHIKKGAIEFSDRDRLQNVSLKDLVEIKRSKELQERRLKERKSKEDKTKEETIMGDDLDIGFDMDIEDL